MSPGRVIDERSVRWHPSVGGDRIICVFQIDVVVNKDSHLQQPKHTSVRLKEGTVSPRYNAVAGRHLLRPPYKRGTLWDPVDLFDIVIPRQRYLGTGSTQRQRERPRPRLEVELV